MRKRRWLKDKDDKMKTKKKEFLKEVKKGIDEILGKYKERKISPKDIEDIISGFNKILIQSYAHDRIMDNGMIPHMERKLIKNEIRFELLKLLSNYFPEAVTEYLIKTLKGCQI